MNAMIIEEPRTIRADSVQVVDLPLICLQAVRAGILIRLWVGRYTTPEADL
jgi:hypothetical protein